MSDPIRDVVQKILDASPSKVSYTEEDLRDVALEVGRNGAKHSAKMYIPFIVAYLGLGVILGVTIVAVSWGITLFSWSTGGLVLLGLATAVAGFYMANVLPGE